MTGQPGWWRCFGTDWLSDIALDQFDSGVPGLPATAVHVERAEALPDMAAVRQQGRLTIGEQGMRFRWNREVEFHIDGRQVDDRQALRWLAGRDWTGTMPDSFYGTVAALMMSLRGQVPMHATSVVIGGRAWLLAGNAGAGKSTLGSELVAAGHPLLADDLTILSVTPDGACLATRGRAAMRLHPSATGWLAHDDAQAMAGDPRGKWLVRPACRAADGDWPVGGIILLHGDRPLAAGERVGGLASVQFRPRIMAAIAGQGQRRAALLRLAASVPVLSLPPVSGFTASDRTRRVDTVLAAIAGAAAVA